MSEMNNEQPEAKGGAPGSSPDAPSAHSRFYLWLRPLIFMASNPISLIGIALVTTATVLWVFLLPTLLRSEASNPYLGIPEFLVLPGVFIFGLILIPIGIVLRRKSREKAGLPVTNLPDLRLDSPELQRMIIFVAVASLGNVIVFTQWGYSAVNYMDTAQFCGQACHTVMQPEYTTYINSPHAHVACAECHIGPGASWFVKSKLDGVGQLVAVTFNTYPRPISSPVANLRPARDTCEHCHWPSRFSGDQFRVHTSYANDEHNEAATTVLLMKVGGTNWRGATGIHGVHVDPNTKMDYIATDGQRQTIPQVTYTAADGKVTVFKSTSAKVTDADLAKGEHRTVDCIDCHNRPTHAFQLPERAVDEAMEKGQISPELPFIKKEAVAALKKEYKDRDSAAQEIGAAIDQYYKTTYPQVYSASADKVKNAAEGVKAIYLRNIFPEMKITWGTHINNLGHTDFPGCFRCHDGDHTSADGKTIPNDCATCHDLLAVEEKDPKVLSSLGYHPGGSGSGK